MRRTTMVMMRTFLRLIMLRGDGWSIWSIGRLMGNLEVSHLVLEKHLLSRRQLKIRIIFTGETDISYVQRWVCTIYFSWIFERASWILCFFFFWEKTVESFYYMWRTTGEEKWRERGWKVFEAIEEITKTSSGYASITTVNQIPPIKKNDMPRYVSLSWLFTIPSQHLNNPPPFFFFWYLHD